MHFFSSIEHTDTKLKIVTQRAQYFKLMLNQKQDGDDREICNLYEEPKAVIETPNLIGVEIVIVDLENNRALGVDEN